MASGSTGGAEATLARLLTGIGWALEGGQPIDRRAVVDLLADHAHLLRRVGALDTARPSAWPGQVTVEGIALARAALGAQQP